MVVAFLLSACGTPPGPDSADRDVENNNVREASIPAGNAALYSRDIGDGLPVIVLHGGPDFDRLVNGYDLLPKLEPLRTPTLVVHGAHDIIPAKISAHIATAIPGSRLVALKDCGHFSYLECPDAVRTAVGDFLSSTTAAPRR